MMLKKILNTRFVLLIFMLGLFPPAYLTRIHIFNIVFNIFKAVAFVFVLLLFAQNLIRHINKSFNILLAALSCELIFATLISREASVYAWLNHMGMVIILSLFIEEMMLYAPYNGLHSLYWYFSLTTMVNTITVFLYPNAMYPNNRGVWVCWFLGEDNGAYFYYILASTFAMLYCNYIAKRVTLLAILDWVNAFVFVFNNDIATGIVCQIIWLILVAGYQFKQIKKLIKAKYALFIMFAGFVFLVIVRNFIFAPIFLALGKTITIGGRTVIWDRTIALIRERPLFGYGVCVGDVFAELIKMPGLTMAHNWILILGFTGGILAIILYVIQIIFAFREGRKFQASAYYRSLVIGLMILYVRSIVDGSYWPGYFIFPAMICYSKEFLNGIVAMTGRTRTIRITIGRHARRTNIV